MVAEYHSVSSLINPPSLYVSLCQTTKQKIKTAKAKSDKKHISALQIFNHLFTFISSIFICVTFLYATLNTVHRSKAFRPLSLASGSDLETPMPRLPCRSRPSASTSSPCESSVLRRGAEWSRALCCGIYSCSYPFYGCFSVVTFLPYKPCVADRTTTTIAHSRKLAVLCAQNSL